MIETRDAIWLEMMKYWGLKELPGIAANKIIVQWFHDFGYDIDDDETAWCSLTMNVMAKAAGCEHTGKLDARSWLKLGREITDPKPGHVVIFWRVKLKGWQGHVGLFAGYTKDKTGIYTLGGNQNNMLGISQYPVKGTDCGLLGFRELSYLQ